MPRCVPTLKREQRRSRMQSWLLRRPSSSRLFHPHLPAGAPETRARTCRGNRLDGEPSANDLARSARRNYATGADAQVAEIGVALLGILSCPSRTLSSLAVGRQEVSGHVE